MAGLSFGSMGATPNSNGAMGWLGSFGYKPSQGSTPAASALNNAQSSRPVVPQQPPTPAPTTAVKSTTITHPDGTSIATTYHPETTPGLINQNTGKTNQQVLDDSTTAANTAKNVLAQSESAPQPQTPQPTTFAGTVGNLATDAQNGSQNATQATTGLLNSPQQNQALSDQAKAIGTNYGDQIAKVSNYGHALAGSYTTGAGLAPVSQGLAGQAENTTANEVQGLGTAENAALAPINQELTAQQQAQSGLTAAGSTANTQQANQQSGLNSAGTLAQPSATSQGQTTYDPLTNSFSGGSYQQNLQTVIQSIKSRNMGYTNGVNSLAGLSPTAKADVLAGLGQGFDTIASDANAATKASNIQTGGTAAVNAGASTYANANPAYLNLKNNVIPNIEGFGELLTQGAGGINPFDSQHINMSLQQFQKELSGPQQAQFQTTFQQLQKSIAALASAGGTQTPTANSAQADASLSPTAKMSTIKSVLDRIKSEGDVYLTNQGNLSNAALSQAQGGSGGSTGNSGATPTWATYGG